MNYGRKETQKKKQHLTSKRAMIRKKFFTVALKSFLVCCVVGIVFAGYTGYKVVQDVISEAPELDLADVTPTGYLSTVYDDSGAEMATLVASGANRVYVTLDQIPKDLQHAFVAIEDSRFYEHNGIDLKGIVRAAYVGLASGGNFSEGASTITQQLLKNNVFTGWTSEVTFLDRLERKLQEQYLAVELEKISDKDFILENYLNSINLGQNTLGVESAAQRYFDKDVSELTLSESAVIAGITQNPGKYNPVSNPQANAQRRQKVLKNMLDQGYITQNEFQKALDDDVYSRIQAVNATQSDSNSAYSYFVDELTDQVIHDLMDVKGYSETEAYDLLYSGGLSIYSTQSSSLQKICEEEINNPDNYPDSTEVSCSYTITIEQPDGTTKTYTEQNLLKHFASKDPSFNLIFSSQEELQKYIEKYKKFLTRKGATIVENSEALTLTIQPQASVTLIDPSTGEVKAIVGGRGDKTASLTLNRATDTTRQPGSTFKILSTFAPALDSGQFTLASVQDDAPYAYANGTSLRNYDNTYLGFTTLRQAITKSINVVTVKTLTDLTPEVGYQYLENFGFTTLSKSDITQSLALGGITNGVTNLELTAAYAAIANKGVYTQPRFYTKIIDHDGNVLIDNTPESHTVLQESTAFLLSDAMKDVMTVGTGVKANFDGMSLAGKSGTTTSNRDAWFTGFSPYYACSVWGGYDDNTSLSSTAYVKTLWRQIMQRANSGLEDIGFTKPDSIISATVCQKSGKLAIEGVCDSDPRGSMIITEYFAKGTEPSDDCDHHVALNICNESGMPASAFCPAASLSRKIFIVGGSEGTADTPYLLSDSLRSSLCTIHSHGQAAPAQDAADPQAPADAQAEDSAGTESSPEAAQAADPEQADPNTPAQ